MSLARWSDLRRFTEARVALGRAGTALPTAAHLDFQEAHAAARDAVWSELRPEALGLDAPVVQSEARDRREYLLRPDLGRRLRAEDSARLPRTGGVVVVVADGLCATGVQSQAAALLAAFAAPGTSPWPVVVALQARVALGDAIGAAMGAEAVVVMIGERPGLSAQDSLGLYLTWQPRPGRTDAERNCISNIRPGGMGHADAAAKLHWLLRGARARGATGVALKDEMPAAPLLPP
jgi:ethanolamine ammonia-lyase small subunit